MKDLWNREIQDKGDNVMAVLEYKGKVVPYKYGYGENVAHFYYDEEKRKFRCDWVDMNVRHKLIAWYRRLVAKLNELLLGRSKNDGLTLHEYRSIEWRPENPDDSDN